MVDFDGLFSTSAFVYWRRLRVNSAAAHHVIIFGTQKSTTATKRQSWRHCQGTRPSRMHGFMWKWGIPNSNGFIRHFVYLYGHLSLRTIFRDSPYGFVKSMKWRKIHDNLKKLLDLGSLVLGWTWIVMDRRHFMQLVSCRHPGNLTIKIWVIMWFTYIYIYIYRSITIYLA